MKAKVYLETTIPSYLVARPSRDLLIAAHQQLTREWWESRGPQFDLFVSEPVLDEAAAGDAILAKKRLALLGTEISGEPGCGRTDSAQGRRRRASHRDCDGLCL